MIGVGWWPFIGYVHARVMSHENGFTLLEMLVVLTIVAILALVAIPGYRQPTEAVLRAEAGACLIQIAGRIERHRLGAPIEEPYSLARAAPDCVDRLSARYQFSVVNASGEITADLPAQGIWILHARSSAVDQAMTQPDCAVLTYHHTGARGVIGRDGTVYSSAEAVRNCWQ